MRRVVTLVAVAAAALLGLPVVSVVAFADAVPVQNPSLEVDADADGVPDCWKTSAFGDNESEATLTTDAHSGDFAERLDVTDYSSGARRLLVNMSDPSCAISVQPGHVLELGVWYKLEGTARLTLWYRNAAGKWLWLSRQLLQPATDWTSATYRTPPLPGDATLVSFGVALRSAGSLTVDDFSADDVTGDQPPPPHSDQLSVQVSGNRLVAGDGTTVRLLGANRSGTQYACAEGWGIFDGPVDDDAISAMKSWAMTAVRVSLNEDCWLGINGVKPQYSGASYRQAIGGFVQRLNAHGLYVILDLHWNAPGNQCAGCHDDGQQPMADRDHAPAFWSSVASYFKDNPAVVFDLYNEPHPDNNSDSTAAWRCVRDGGNCPGVPFVAAGMQELVNAVRAAGATNPIMVGGPQYAGDVDRWLEFEPDDPLNQLVVSVHIYGPDWAPCWTPSCWNGQLAPLAAKVPIVMGEIGTHDVCGHDFIDQLMTWADQHGVSYLAWSWIVGSCTGEPSLIKDYNGTPTPYGVGLRNHLLSLNDGG